MNMPQLPDLRGTPYYNEPSSYMIMMDRTWAWEFSGWKKESLSWKTGCYIHAGLSDNQMNFSGPDALKFFESISVNNFDVEHSEIGTEVDVQWGDHGRRIKCVRATVERFPYLTDGRNSDIDLKKR